MSEADRKSLTYIPDDLKFYGHQITGVRKLCRMGSAILADEMGLGKSLQALTVFAVDVQAGFADSMLVVATPTLKGNWYEEIGANTLFKNVLILEGSPANRRQALQDFAAMESPKILLVNYEQVVAHVDELNALKFSVVAYDEAHLIKNPRSKRTKACQRLVAERHLCLTGSPMLNHVDELWSLLHRVAPDEFPNYHKFVQRYCVFGGFKNKQIVGVKNEKELHNRLQSVMLRRLKKDVLDLPDKLYVPVVVELSPEQRKVYDTVRNEMILPSPDEATAEDIDNALTMFLRLKQITGTTACLDGYPDHSSKLDRAVEMILELSENGHKVVVFTQFRGVLHALEDRLAAVAVDGSPIPVWTLHGDVPKEERVPRVRQWTDHKGPGVVLAMLQVAAVGLNMTAARHAIFLDKLFVPKLNEQAEDRLHRIGADKTQPIEIFSLIARGTVEYRVEQILKRKVRIFNEIVEENSPATKAALYAAIYDEENE